MSEIVTVSTTDTPEGVRTLVLDIPRPSVLSSNVDVHFRVKPKLIRQLRQVAIENGLAFHSEDEVKAVKKRLVALQERTDWQTKKSNLSKTLKKKGLSKAEIDEKLLEVIGSNATYDVANAITVPYLYEKARVRVLIGNTVNRDFDPPNFWPTIKAITDGLTDCAWWKDDNYNHLTEISFGYGERSDAKGHYRFQIIVEPVLSAELGV